MISRSSEPRYHRMLTIGSEQLGVRATMGRLSRAGRWHSWQPCLFMLVNGRRRDLRRS